jgi:TPR repeat protein
MELINVEFITLDLHGVKFGQMIGEPKEQIENIQPYSNYDSLINGIRNNLSNYIFQLACCYEYGAIFSIKDEQKRVRLISPNIETALLFYEIAYRSGSEDAANQLGMMYHHGVHVKADKNVSKELFRYAASKNNVNALFIMGVYLIHELDYTTGYDYFLRAADLGHAAACFNVALALHNGDIVWGKNNPQALYYAKTALDQMPDDVECEQLINKIYNEIMK